MLESPFAVGVLTVMGGYYTKRGMNICGLGLTVAYDSFNPQNLPNASQSSTPRAMPRVCSVATSKLASTEDSMAA